MLRVIAPPSVLPRATLLPNQYFAMSSSATPSGGSGSPAALPGPSEAAAAVLWPKSKLVLLQTRAGSNQGRSVAAAAAGGVGEIQDVCCSGGLVRLNAIHQGHAVHGVGVGGVGGMRPGVKLVARPVGAVGGHRPRLVAVQCPVVPLGHHHHHHGVVMQAAAAATSAADGSDAGEPNRTSVFRELTASRSSLFPHRPDATAVQAGAVPASTVGQLVPYPSCSHRYSLLDCCCCCCCCDEQTGWRPVDISTMRPTPLPGLFYGQGPEDRRTDVCMSSSSSSSSVSSSPSFHHHHHHHHPHHAVNPQQSAKNRNKSLSANGGVPISPATFVSILGPPSPPSESGVLVPFPAYHPHPTTTANFLCGSGSGKGSDEGSAPPVPPPPGPPKEPKSPPGGVCSGLNVDALPFISHNSTVGVCMYHDWFSDPTFQVLGGK